MAIIVGISRAEAYNIAFLIWSYLGESSSSDNGGHGIIVDPTGAGITVKAAFNGVEVHNNSFSGIVVGGRRSTGTINANVTDSVSANNFVRGFVADSTAGQSAINLMVVRSVAANHNSDGIVASDASNVTVRISQVTVAGNGRGLNAVGGNILSYGDNNVDATGLTEHPRTRLPRNSARERRRFEH